MTKIIGQTKLMSAIDSFTGQSLPKTMLFIGPSGCGKHLVSRYIAQRFELDYTLIEESVTPEELESYTLKTLNTLYVIDLNKFSEKQQNQFLKFIEEPSKSVYIVLLANSEVGILPTVLNRCSKYFFDAYSKEELEQILNNSVNDLAFEIFKTPGKLLNLTDTSFKDLLDLGEKVVQKIGQVSYGNVLIISTRINYKDLYSKIDFNLFFDVIEYLALEDFKRSGNRQSLIIFEITAKFKQYIAQQNLLKEALMLNYLTTLWEAVQT
jgi:DNA polymerase III gamma/tau subunit